MSKYLIPLIIALGFVMPFKEIEHTQQVVKGDYDPYTVKTYARVDPGTG